MAPKSMPVNSPSDMMVAIRPILSGPMIVKTALSAAKTSAAIRIPIWDFIYPAIRGAAVRIPPCF